MQPIYHRLFARILRRTVRGFVPRPFRLGFDYNIACMEGRCETEVMLAERLGSNTGTALDIGANEGLYTYRLSRLYERVHAFEIHPGLAQRLSALAPPNVTVHHTGLSSRAGTDLLRVPRIRNRELLGWASLEIDNCDGAESYDTLEVEIAPLDSQSIHYVKFIKADVEGHEFELMIGAEQTIRSNMPNILIEIRDANLERMRKLLKGWDFVEVPIESRLRRHGSPGNYLFSPSAA